MNRTSICESKGLAYGIAVSAVGLAILARMAFDSYLGKERLTYAFFFLPVIFTAWLCGWRLALLSAVLGLVSGNFFFMSPRYSIEHLSTPELMASIIYSAISLTIIVFAHFLRKARDQAISHKNDLEREITERKRAEAEMKSIGKRYLTLFEETSDGVWLANLKGEIIEINDAYCRMSGYTREELIGKHLSAIEALESPHDILDRITKKIVGVSGSHRFESKHRRRDGSVFDVDITTVYLEREGLIAGFARDVTSRKHAQEELRQSRDQLESRVRERTAQLQESEKGLRKLTFELINAQETERRRIAHELHDSLTAQLAAIQYKLERKRSDGESPVTSIPIDEIIKDVKNANTETRRIMANLRPLVLDDLGILPALSWYSREIRNAYPEVSVEYSADIQESDIPENLNIILFRVAQESIRNSIRHGKSTLIRIVLQKEGNWLRLMIEDNGIGFESIKRTVNGGIGLVSMQQRVESTAGIFSISSSPGKGTIIKAEWRIG